MKTRFFKCNVCGNVIVKFEDSGANVSCCGQEMTELMPSVTDGAREKHVPVVECPDEHTIKVRIGAMPHPMTKEHCIRFICLETRHGLQIKYLSPDCEPEARFCICKDKPVAVYEYCNLHGLWKTEIHCESDKTSCEK